MLYLLVFAQTSSITSHLYRSGDIIYRNAIIVATDFRSCRTLHFMTKECTVSICMTSSEEWLFRACAAVAIEVKR